MIIWGNFMFLNWLNTLIVYFMEHMWKSEANLFLSRNHFNILFKLTSSLVWNTRQSRKPVSFELYRKPRKDWEVVIWVMIYTLWNQSNNSEYKLKNLLAVRCRELIFKYGVYCFDVSFIHLMCSIYNAKRCK